MYPLVISVPRSGKYRDPHVHYCGCVSEKNPTRSSKGHMRVGYSWRHAENQYGGMSRVGDASISNEGLV